MSVFMWKFICSRVFKASLILMFPHQNYVYACILPHSCHIPCPSYPRLCHHPKVTCHYKSWSPSPCNSLQSPNISSLSCPSSAIHSQMPSTYVLPWMSNSKCVLITISTTICTCINTNSDFSCVFYIILHHAEGRLRKAKITTNQHLSCTLKTSGC